MDSFIIYVKYTCKPGCREAFLNELTAQGIVDAIRREDGCIRYDYYLSVQDDNTLLLIEQWASEAHQQTHMGQPHMAALRAAKEKYVEATLLGRVTLQ